MGCFGGRSGCGRNAFDQFLIVGGGNIDVLHGSAASDVIVGDEFTTQDSAENWIAGYSGDDNLLGATGVDRLYGNAMPIVIPGIGGVLNGTPDVSTVPADTTGIIKPYEYLNDLLAGTVSFFSLDAQAGTDLPGDLTTTIDLSNAFALEGLAANESLSTVIAAGDVNDDGEDDFLVAGEFGQSYLMFGPVVQSSLFRATSDANAVNGPVVNVRGSQWSFEQTFGLSGLEAQKFEDLAPSVRAEGRASVIFDSALGKAVGAGHILGDAAADLVFLSETPSDFVISIVAGGQTLNRNIATATETITLSKSGFNTSLDDIQIQILDWTGPSRQGGDGYDDIVVVGQPGAGAGPDTSRVAGYIFDGYLVDLINRDYSGYQHRRILVQRNFKDRHDQSGCCPQRDQRWIVDCATYDERISRGCSG